MLFHTSTHKEKQLGRSKLLAPRWGHEFACITFDMRCILCWVPRPGADEFDRVAVETSSLQVLAEFTHPHASASPSGLAAGRKTVF